jgi:hypothetical protein
MGIFRRRPQPAAHAAPDGPFRLDENGARALLAAAAVIADQTEAPHRELMHAGWTGGCDAGAVNRLTDACLASRIMTGPPRARLFAVTQFRDCVPWSRSELRAACGDAGTSWRFVGILGGGSDLRDFVTAGNELWARVQQHA